MVSYGQQERARMNKLLRHVLPFPFAVIGTVLLPGLVITVILENSGLFYNESRCLPSCFRMCAFWAVVSALLAWLCLTWKRRRPSARLIVGFVYRGITLYGMIAAWSLFISMTTHPDCWQKASPLHRFCGDLWLGDAVVGALCAFVTVAFFGSIGRAIGGRFAVVAPILAFLLTSATFWEDATSSCANWGALSGRQIGVLVAAITVYFTAALAALWVAWRNFGVGQLFARQNADGLHESV